MMPLHRLIGAAILALGAAPRAVLAHPGAPPEPHDLWSAWSSDPSVLLGLVLIAWLYARGLGALWRRAGVGRGVRRWQAAAFAAGWAALFVALVSPLDALGAALFSAHMSQHLVLVTIAAPLLVLGLPIVPMLWALPEPSRRALGAWWRWAWVARGAACALTQPLVAWTLHTVALWVWHLPSLYQAALRSELVHLAEHASFLGTALLFWWTVVHPGPRGASGYGLGVLAVFAMAMQSGILGALMTFSPTPWYPAYAATVAAWGLTPLEDQQLGGIIMWVPGGFLYLAAALALFVAWIGAVDGEAWRSES